MFFWHGKPKTGPSSAGATSQGLGRREESPTGNTLAHTSLDVFGLCHLKDPGHSGATPNLVWGWQAMVRYLIRDKYLGSSVAWKI